MAIRIEHIPGFAEYLKGPREKRRETFTEGYLYRLTKDAKFSDDVKGIAERTNAKLRGKKHLETIKDWVYQSAPYIVNNLRPNQQNSGMFCEKIERVIEKALKEPPYSKKSCMEPLTEKQERILKTIIGIIEKRGYINKNELQKAHGLTPKEARNLIQVFYTREVIPKKAERRKTKTSRRA